MTSGFPLCATGPARAACHLLRYEDETIFVFISYLISFFPNRSTDNERNVAKSSAAKRANGNGWNAVDAIPVVKSWSEHETR